MVLLMDCYKARSVRNKDAAFESHVLSDMFLQDPMIQLVSFYFLVIVLCIQGGCLLGHWGE